MIPQTTLGKTGLRVGRLGLGTWEIGDQKIASSKVAAMLTALLDHGGNVIDTSDNYDGAEKILGQALKGFRRDDFVIVTKCGDYTSDTFDRATGLSTNDPKYKYARLNFSPKVIARNIDASLKRLRVDVLDVCILHTPFMSTLLKGDCIDALIRAQEQGKIKFIGYSGDNEEVVYCSQIPEFSVIEMSLNITDLRNGLAPLLISNQHHMGTLVKRPLANAFWRKDIYKVAYVYATDYRNRAIKMRINPEQFGLPPSEAGFLHLAFAFSLGLPVDVLIPGTTRLDHMLQNIKLVEKLSRIDTSGIVNAVVDLFYAAQNEISAYSKGRIWLGLE